jgi:hypothetical protein
MSLRPLDVQETKTPPEYRASTSRYPFFSRLTRSKERENAAGNAFTRTRQASPAPAGFRLAAEHCTAFRRTMSLFSQLLPDFPEKAEDAVNKRVYIATRP